MSLVPFEGAIEGIVSVINKFIPDTAGRDAAKAQITEQLLTIATQENTQQADIDQAEASSGNIFEAGWRPALGWTCVLTFAGHYVLQPTFFFLKSCLVSCTVQPYDIAEINNILYALLGIGGLRSLDKNISNITKILK